jgi:hypothetical protein
VAFAARAQRSSARVARGCALRRASRLRLRTRPMAAQHDESLLPVAPAPLAGGALAWSDDNMLAVAC